MDLPEINTPKLTEEQIKNSPKSDYMNDEQQAFFKDKLLALYEATNLRIQEAKDRMSKPLDGLSDPSDRASWEEQSSIAFRIADREKNLVPKIQQSLERIRLGTYGYCLESDEPIGIPRLLARPTAEYCADVKEIQELKETRHRN